MTYRLASGGFTLSWGEPADPDRLCWFRKASRARRRLSLSISSASSILRWAVTLQEENETSVTPQDNHISFLTHVEWWMTLSPEECCWQWCMELLKKSLAMVCLVPCLRFGAGVASALAFDTASCPAIDRDWRPCILCVYLARKHTNTLFMCPTLGKGMPHKLISLAT